MKYSSITLMTDLYQLTMMQGYYLTGIYKRKVVFDVFYRSNPQGSGYSVACGLEQIIDYISNIKFTPEDISYLKSLNIFESTFLEYIEGFHFSGTIFAVPEGTVIFPTEPIIRVEAPIIEAQFIETTLLNLINHQSLIATKAARIVHAAGGDVVLEFGLRRAQGPDAGIFGARAAMIGGCHATSNVLAGKMFNVPVKGTHAHSWIMSFNDELTAFREYAKIFPSACTLLVDTYNTLKSGVPNAIKVFTEMRDKGISLKSYGIRLDSGDLTFLSNEARVMLNEAGFHDATISASNDLDELLIRELKLQGTKITVWGVGTNLITSKDCPAFGCVYKLAAKEENGIMRPTIKVSDNIEKITNPGVKKTIRLYDNKTGKIKADLIALAEETIDTSKDIVIFDPIATWKKMLLRANEYSTRELLVPIFENGKNVYTSPSVMEIRDYCTKEKATLWEEHKRLVNPHILPVDLSNELWKLKEDMIAALKK